MSEMRFETLTMPGVKLGPDGIFPALRSALFSKIGTRLEENDGLFIGFGMRPNAFPHTPQDDYTDRLEERTFATIVLENPHLRAVFIPELGGRLWSLHDKDHGRDLLTVNPAFKPGNFAIRNAWAAGGVEWNTGRRGHDAQTMSPLFTARLADTDGTPVLRFYEMCRETAVARQFEFYLPEDSRFLLVRFRVLNDHEFMIPMYHWSNIAVPERAGMRIVVPAPTTFANTYVSDSEHYLSKLPMPFNEGIDCTRPQAFWNAKDHFYNIPVDVRRFEAAVYADGTGMVQASTRRLRGRKLFVWGMSPGGRHWQRKLTIPGAEPYVEIQAGLAQTQLECLPMPPKTAWEWLEAYGAVDADPAKIHGDWQTAVDTVRADLDARLPESWLDAELERTREAFALRPGELLSRGSGFGALENRRRAAAGEALLPAHLDFGEIGDAQREWVALIEKGDMPETDPATVPGSWNGQPEFRALLRKAVDAGSRNWLSCCHLGASYFAAEDYERARKYYERSEELAPNAWAVHGLANCDRMAGDFKRAAERLRLAAERVEFRDYSVVKEALRTCCEAEEFDALLAWWPRLPAAFRERPMLKFFHAFALAAVGRADEAEKLLFEGLDAPDIREGENSLSELYIKIEQERARQRGETVPAAESIPIPPEFDLRMNSPRS